MSDAPTYTREEMDAILRRALERQQAKAEGIGHDELVDAAAEVGIPREEVEAAAREIEATKADRESRAALRARAVARFSRGLTAWALASVVFASLALVRHETAFFWPILFWGLAIALRAVRVFLTKDYESTGRERRRRRRDARLAEFEDRVQVGADALGRVLDEIRQVKGRSAEEAARIREKTTAKVRMKIDFEPMTPTRLHTTPVTPSRPRVSDEDDDESAETIAREDARRR